MKSDNVYTINGLDVKRELTEKRPKGAESTALLSGFVRVCFSLLKRGSGVDLMLDCQSEYVRDYIASLMFEQFKITPSGGVLGQVVAPTAGELVFSDSAKILTALLIQKDNGVFDFNGIDERFLKNAEYYARGVFLGCGSLSVPKADNAQSQKSGGYHLEFSFTTESLANDFLGLLSRYSIYGHLTVRAEKYIVYVKDSESVSDTLALIGADKAVLKLNEAVAAFAVKSDVIRRMNCDLANMGRTVDAAVEVISAIKIIEEKAGLDVLDKKLRAAAEARLKSPQAPIGALADMLGISKSGLKHRFDRIIRLSREVGGKGEDTEE